MSRRGIPRVSRSRAGRVRGIFVLCGLAGLAVALALLAPTRQRGNNLFARTEVVRRVDLDSIILATGRAESVTNTEIRCTLERLATGGSAAGASTIIRMADEGTTVKKGDVLCELDASDFEELVRQQLIVVQTAQASFRQAELDLQTAKLELDAFREGELYQTDRLLRSQMALAESEITRQNGRLLWTQRMFEKGYSSKAQVSTETEGMLKASLTLEQAQMSLTNYHRFTAAKTLKMFESDINAAKAALDFQTIRKNREEEKLRHYQAMVERCTIRAPNDGFLVYANRPGRQPDVYEGATVNQGKRLFLLPDLDHMEVQALLHETMVERVKPGMPVRVWFEALPGHQVEGVVTEVSPLPLLERKTESTPDVTYFLGRIKLDTDLAGLRPGMTAIMEILTAQRPDVLAVPSAAIHVEKGRKICQVLRGTTWVKSPVKLGESNQEMTEILGGLAEGDIVALDASSPPPVSEKVNTKVNAKDGTRPRTPAEGVATPAAPPIPHG